jgi:hypothetical protein
MLYSVLIISIIRLHIITTEKYLDPTWDAVTVAIWG